MSLKTQLLNYLSRVKAGDSECVHEYMEGNLKRAKGLKHEVVFGKHTVTVDEPLSFGGSDSAANPAEVALAGLAASISDTLQALAAMEDIPIDDLTIKLSGTLSARGFFDLDPDTRAGFGGLEVSIQIDSPAPEKAIQRLVKRMERSCPVLDTVRNPTPVSITLAR